MGADSILAKYGDQSQLEQLCCSRICEADYQRRRLERELMREMIDIKKNGASQYFEMSHRFSIVNLKRNKFLNKSLPDRGLSNYQNLLI